VASYIPRFQLADAPGHQCLGRWLRVRPARVSGRSLGPEQQPVDLADIPRSDTGPLVREVPEHVGGGGDPAGLLGDQGYPFAHPGIFDEFSRLPFESGQYGADRCAYAGYDRGGVRIHQLRELIPVAAAERAYVDCWHLQASMTRMTTWNVRRPLPVRYIQDASKPARDGAATSGCAG
jgi:hypothetical protein